MDRTIFTSGPKSGEEDWRELGIYAQYRQGKSHMLSEPIYTGSGLVTDYYDIMPCKSEEYPQVAIFIGSVANGSELTYKDRKFYG